MQKKYNETSENTVIGSKRKLAVSLPKKYLD